MPRITVSVDQGGTVTHTEWVSPADFSTEHFRLQLAERLAWAVEDAADRPEIEQPEPEARHDPAEARFDHAVAAV